MRSKLKNPTYTLLVDIGSGSVGFAIVQSHPNQEQPEIIWEVRQSVKLKDVSSISESRKAIVTTLMDMALTVTQEGIAALRNATGDSKATITSTLATIAAPWSYCVTQPVKYEKIDGFSVTEKLVSDLAQTAGTETLVEFEDSYPDLVQDITATSRTVLEVRSSGYKLPSVNNQRASTVTLTQATTMAHRNICDALKEMQHKLFAKTPINITGSVLSLYSAIRVNLPHEQDITLIDVTNEATEVGIVRDGALRYCSHISFGSASIAREIAHISGKPLVEIHNQLGASIASAPKKDRETLIQAYEDKLFELLSETGDPLSTPRSIYLLSDDYTADFLRPIIERVGKRATKSPVKVLSISELQQYFSKSADRALQINTAFFHTQENQLYFEYL